jgi:multiple sugar transport system substrate-binding protein
MKRSHLLPLAITFILILTLAPVMVSFSAAQKQKVVLTAVLSDEGRWDSLIAGAKQKLNQRHPNMDIQIQYQILPYEKIKPYMLKALTNQTPIDVISLDQIWLGEFAGKGILSDLGDRAKAWGRSSDWYPVNWEGGKYNGKVYGIWAWTDVRGMWYWKDLISQAGVNPDSLKTWNGYIESAKKLDTVLRPKGIEGMHLVGANHSQDMWYPYLWMLGGDILELKDGHPTKGNYWFPSFNSTEGVKALEFIKAQINAGIKPQLEHHWGQEFVDRKFAVMLEGSWMPGEFPQTQLPGIKQQVGFLPMFPVPHEGNRTATTMGGWELSVPQTAKNKDLAWELLTLMVQPDILTPVLAENGYLPTQQSIGQGSYAKTMNQSIPYYAEMVSMIPFGHKRPSIPEYTQIADQIRHAINEVYYGRMAPKQALDEAAAKSAKVLGW